MARHSGRDTNLTDTLFRLHSLLGDALDEAAHEREPELDAIVAARQRGAWWRFDRVFNTAYEVDTTHACCTRPSGAGTRCGNIRSPCGTSWNFVLWGLYHGTLVVVTRALGRVLRLPERWPGPLAFVQIAATFVLMMAGWLLFRETNATFLLRDLSVSPFTSSAQERAIAFYLFVTAATWALPLMIDDAFALWRERTEYWQPVRVWPAAPRLASEMAMVGGLLR